MKPKGPNKIDSEWNFEVAQRLIVDGECPNLAQKVEVLLSARALDQCRTLCEKFPALEWMAALIGTESEDRMRVHVEELKLFEQRVSAVSVELTSEGNAEFANAPNIGWIHSHNAMNVFFSATDLATAGMSGLSVIVNNRMEFTGKALRSVRCGHDALLEAEVTVAFERDEELARQADLLISEQALRSVEAGTAAYSDDGQDEWCFYCGDLIDEGPAKLLTWGWAHPACAKEIREEVMHSGAEAGGPADMLEHQAMADYWHEQNSYLDGRVFEEMDELEAQPFRG